MKRTDAVMTGVGGSPWYSSMYWDPGNVGTPAQDCIDAAMAFWNTVKSGQENAVLGEVQAEVTTIDVATGNPTAVEVGTAGTWVGVVDGELLPRATQGLARWLTGEYVGGRQVRGRTFVPGWTESNNDVDGTPSAAAIGFIQSAIDAVLLETAVLCIYARASRTVHAVNGGSPWGEWAILRSRRD